jgi:hypothetical protein
MLLSDGVPPPVLYVVISVLNMLSSCGFLNWSFLLQLMFCALVVCAGAHDLQFVIPVCLFQLVISEAGPTQGALLFLLLYYQQAPPGPALQDSTTSALYRAPSKLAVVFVCRTWGGGCPTGWPCSSAPPPPPARSISLDRLKREVRCWHPTRPD